MTEARRTSGEAVISEGIRLMHSCWRHVVLATVSPSSRRALASASPAGGSGAGSAWS